MFNLYIPSSKYQLNKFMLYTDNFLDELEDIKKRVIILKEKYGENSVLDKIEEKTNDFIKKDKVKVTHSVDVAYDSKRVGVDLNLFNEENISILWTCGLLHDIGRFAQLKFYGTFRDADSFSDLNDITNHGELGKKILIDEKVINTILPFNRSYDHFIGEVVGNHFESKVEDFKIDSKDNSFNNYGLKEIIKDVKKGKNSAQEMYNRLISWYVKIIQDVDRFDILKQVERKDFIPLISNLEKDNVDPYIYDLFYNGKYINMRELKKQGIWTCNAGQLLRWSFLYQTSLVSTIKNVKNLKLIENIWEQNPIDNLKPGYLFTLSLMDALIETSEDGIHVDKEKALKLVRGN